MECAERIRALNEAIEKALKEHPDKKIIIFSYGEAGRLVKRQLNECYGVREAFIVDNHYAKFNSEIKPLTYLTSIGIDGYVMLFAKVLSDSSADLWHQVCAVFPENRIYDAFGEHASYSKRSGILDVDDLIGGVMPKRKLKEDKIKVCLLPFHARYSWGRLATICRAFKDDKRFDVVLLSFYHDHKCFLKEKSGCRCLIVDDYDFYGEQPDILICVSRWMGVKNDYPEILPSEHALRHYRFKLVATIMTKSVPVSDSVEYVRSAMEECSILRPDIWLLERPICDFVESNHLLMPNIVEIAGAELDLIYEGMENAEIPRDWEKLDGKKVVLYMPDHGSGSIVQVHDKKYFGYTFDLYARRIFAYANKHSDIGIILRFHHAMIIDFKKYYRWTDEDLLRLRSFLYNASVGRTRKGG